MSYTPQTWTDNDPTTPLSGARLTHIESGIAAADTAAAAAAAAAAAEATTRAAAITAEASARDTAITTAVNNLLNGAPGALDTLKELADAINDDASFAATVTTALAARAPLVTPDADTNLTTTLSVNKHNYVTTAGTARSRALPTGQALGATIIVENADGAAAFTVTGNIRGVGSSSLTLTLAHESVTFVADAAGSWWPLSGHKTLASLQTLFSTLFAPITGSAAYGPYGLAIGRGACVVPVGSANLVGNFASTGTETAASYRSFFPISDPTCVEVLPVFSNQPNNTGQVGDQRAPNDITIAAAIELSDGTVVPFTFNGQHTVTIPRGGGLAIPDHPLNIGVQVTDGNWGVGGVYIRTYVSVAASRIDTAGTTSGSSTITDASVVATDQGRPVTGTGIPVLSFVGAVTPGTSFTLVNILGTAVNATVTNASASLSILSLWPLNQSTLSTGVKKVATTDLTLEGSTAGSAGFGGSNSNSYGPAFILGKVPATRKPLIASITDSIFHGTTDQQTGPVQRAAATLGLPHVKMSKVSETAAALTTPAGRKYRAHLLQGATHGVIELGTNDGIDTVPKATTLQTNLTTLLTYLNSLGGKWWVTTVPPKGASSTDGYATTGGQTPNSLAAAQAQINTWIRGGCSGLAAGFIELADVVCSARDSGLWAQHPTRGRHLTDLATTSGSNVVTSASAAFTSADIGLGIFVTGVYTNVTAVISTIVDAQTVTVTNTFVGGSALNAGSTVSGAVGGVGAWYATADGTHPSAAMMIGGVLTNVSAALSAMTL